MQDLEIDHSNDCEKILYLGPTTKHVMDHSKWRKLIPTKIGSE